jgi:hypothetical protein
MTNKKYPNGATGSRSTDCVGDDPAVDRYYPRRKTMKAYFLPAMLAVFALSFAAIPAVGQAPRAPGQELKPAEEREKELVLKPELSREQAAELANARANARSAAPAALVACGTTTRIAVSVSGSWHGTAGASVLLPYQNVVTDVSNTGSAWFGPAYFIAPCSGLYFFTVSFVKDSYYNTCGGNFGTQDDVGVYLAKFPSSTVYGPGALSGEGAGRRGTGVYSVVLQLNQSDVITSWVYSDGAVHRCLASYHFTGFLISP